jgi:tetratricopeptide (TPR) repeat protein
VVYFHQAVERDPNFALGWVDLADSFEGEDRPTKKEYIRRALQIDDSLAEAHASLGYQLMCDRDWLASERELKRAMTLDPNYAQSYAWNGVRLMMIGKYDESLAAIQRGLDLDPTANGINFYKGVCLAVSGRRDEAIQQFKRLQEMDPTFPWAHSFLSRFYAWTGDRAAAVEERAKAWQIDGKPEQARMFRESFAKGGWNGYLKEVLKLRTPGTAAAAGDLAQLGEKEKAIEALNKAAEEGGFWLFLIKVDRAFDSLRGDPRFEALVKKFDAPK